MHNTLGPKKLVSSTYGTFYYLTNAQGDVTGLVNSSGVLVVEYHCDAWGNLLSTTGSMASTLGAVNPLRYRGYVYDTETGLYYLQSRYYDPEMGRFINADAFASTGQGILGNNMFAYCNNNPVAFSDPNGYALWPTTKIINDGGSGFGGSIGGNSSTYSGGIIPVVPRNVIDEITDVITDSGTWISNQVDELWEALTKSFAKAKATTYRWNREVHHLVAKSAPNASQAAAILNQTLPNGVEDDANKISIKTGLHRRLHTKLYYSITNGIIISAYNNAKGDPEMQIKNVYAALGQIRSIVAVLDALAPY